MQLVAPQGGAPGGAGAAAGNVALLQSDAGNYQIISSDEESSSSGVPTASASAATSGNVNPTQIANIANLQNLPAGTQLQFQPINQQQAQQQQQQQIAFSGMKAAPNRNVASMAAARQGVQQVRLCAFSSYCVLTVLS